MLYIGFSKTTVKNKLKEISSEKIFFLLTLFSAYASFTGQL